MAAGRVKGNGVGSFDVALRTDVALKAVHFFKAVSMTWASVAATHLGE